MPLFFFVSGYLFKTDKNFKSFFKKRYFSIVKPFFTFAFLTYLLHRFFFLLTNNKNFSTINDLFISLLYGNAFNDHMSWNPPLWFLPCLMTLLVLYYFIEKFQKSITIFLISIILIFFRWYLLFLPRNPFAVGYNNKLYGNSFFRIRLSN